MKTLLFDLLNAQPSKTSKFHGGGEYIKSIFEHLVMNFTESINIMVFYDEERFLDDWIKELIAEKKIKTFLVHSVNDVKDICTENRVDVFFSGLPEHYKKEWFSSETKLIGTIHGLRKIEKSHDCFEYKYSSGKNDIKSFLRNIKWSLKTLKKAAEEKEIANQQRVIDMLDEIVCVSEHTYYALKYYYPQIAKNKIHLFYSPAKNATVEETDLEIRMVSEKYILLIGGDRWLKNSYRALKAIDSLYNKGYLKDTRTVLVGGTSDTIKSELKNSEMFKWLPYVKTSELENLYKYCEIFVYPSLNEGFGYPPIEAMNYGTTCIVSAVCSLPEICGDAVYYVNPYDIPEIANRILHAMDSKLPKNAVEKQVEKINRKQKEDLHKISEFLVNIE